MKNKYDIIVVGAGHAGVEAAHISAKMGKNVLLLTSNVDNISHFSCNPSIGGVAKGQIVQEIDILGGIMPRIADESFLQFKILNRSKGPSVWSPRAQSDKIVYKNLIKKELLKLSTLNIYQTMVEDVIFENNKIVGVVDEYNCKFYSDVVILTTGTFLKGEMFIGLNSISGGRDSDKESKRLSNNLSKHGLIFRRLKTGTPARVSKGSLDFGKMQIEHGDNEINFSFSQFSNIKDVKNIPCYLTHTNNKTHEKLKSGFKFSPLFSKMITGLGPRYCPSIEDKLVKFSKRDSHHIFLEPESEFLDEYYVNGFSSSLPSDIILEAMRTVPGMENVEQIKPAYGIEYDCLEPFQIKYNLETRSIENLFCAGQINGTSGYEEAAAQGLIAGINAVLKIEKKEPFLLSRSSSYIGVMIDDIVSKDITEPYRMFTSRAEYRLNLRMDNVTERLLPISSKYGLLNELELSKLKEDVFLKNEIMLKFKEKKIEKKYFNITTNNGFTIYSALKRADVNLEKILSAYPDIRESYNYNLLLSTEIKIKYEGYILRQKKEIEKFNKYEDLIISNEFNIDNVSGLLNEAKEKFLKIRPTNLAQFSMIDGVTPADVKILLYYLLNLKK